MDSNDEYEDGADTRALMEHGYAAGGYEDEVERHNSSSSENGDDSNNPPVLSPPHTMDIPSICRPPVPAMVPADRVSTHDLPLAAPLVVVERELIHNGTRSEGFGTCVKEGEERKRMLKKRREELTNREFELKTLKIEREILELKMKMKELTKAGGMARGAHSQGVRCND